MATSTEQTETVTVPPVPEASEMDTSADIVPVETEEQQPVNGTDEDTAETDNSKASKRKRSSKKVVEPTENISNGRPKRNLSKRKSISFESSIMCRLNFR